MSDDLENRIKRIEETLATLISWQFGVVLGVVLEALPGDALEDPASPARFFFLPDLKSVSYQPPPDKRKPAAEICFLRLALAHAGQSTKGESLNFCKASSAWLQDSHWYS